jgi:hypothetical protein
VDGLTGKEDLGYARKLFEKAKAGKTGKGKDSPGES